MVKKVKLAIFIIILSLIVIGAVIVVISDYGKNTQNTYTPITIQAGSVLVATKNGIEYNFAYQPDKIENNQVTQPGQILILYYPESKPQDAANYETPLTLNVKNTCSKLTFEIKEITDKQAIIHVFK
jgi:hypothetical protein